MPQFTVADVPGAFARGQQFRQEQQMRPLQIDAAQQALANQQQQFNQQEQLAPLQFQAAQLGVQGQQQQIDQRTDQQKNQSLFNTALRVDSASDDEIIPILQAQIKRVKNIPGGDASTSELALKQALAGDFERVRRGAKNLIEVGVRQGDIQAPAGQQRSAGQREFESKLTGLDSQQKKEAILIDLGLAPRAVGSAIQTITSKGIEGQIGDASAVIKEREKFGELTGSSRSKAIDKGVEKIQKINVGIQNIDKAVALLNEGAGVGAIERWIPSIKGSTTALNNLQSTMALDVIGAVTFGALSQGELDLAKNVALNTKLDTPELIADLQARKIAQEKLRSYFNEQIQFLDQGGSVAGFLRSKQRELDANQQQQQTETQQQQVPEGALKMLQQNPALAEQFQSKFGFLPEGF